MEVMSLTGKRRDALGTRASRRLREDGWVPIVIYGHNEPPEPVTITRHDAELALTHGAHMLELDVEGQKQRYLIKDVQYDHFDHLPLHMDLMRVAMDETVRVSIGIQLRGTPKGVAEEDGVLELLMPDIEVECFPGDIPDTLHPMVVHLGIGDALTVADLDLPPNVKPMVDADERVAIVRRKTEEVEPEEAVEVGEEAEAAEPEVIRRAREGEEEEGG